MNGPVRVFLTILGIAGAAAAVLLLLVLPLRRHAEEDRAVILERREQLVKLERVAQRINQCQTEIKRLEEALAFFEGRLPQQREMDVILRDVWRIAESKSLTPRAVRTGPLEVAARYNSQPITMNLEGRFTSLYEFLLGLERMPRITKVRQMQITKIPKTEGMIQVDLLVDIFFEKKQ
jgi:Tfp pilus assembly protein PilO